MDLRRALCFSTCVLIVTGCSWAGERTSVAGQVRSSGLLGMGEITVELSDSSHGRPVERTTPSGDGNFEFDNVPVGQYEVRAVDQHGTVLRQEFVEAMDTGNFVILQLPDTKPPERPVSGTVSVSTLRHKVPGKALKEYEKSAQALKKGDPQQCVAHLQKAIAIDPDFMQAHNNLGSRYFAAGDPEKAATEFQRALSLAPDSEPVRANFALALMAARRYPEAEKAARSALELGHTPKVCLALGVSLREQWRGTSEAIEHLIHAEKDFPKARLAVARILADEGQPARAAGEVRAYLAADSGPDREEVQKWLAQLDANGAGSGQPETTSASLHAGTAGKRPAN